MSMSDNRKDPSETLVVRKVCRGFGGALMSFSPRRKTSLTISLRPASPVNLSRSQTSAWRTSQFANWQMKAGRKLVCDRQAKHRTVIEPIEVRDIAVGIIPSQSVPIAVEAVAHHQSDVLIYSI